MKLWHVWARRMYADGKSQSEIARALRKAGNTVRWALDINGEQERTADRIRKQRGKKHKRSGFSAEERAKRSARLKALWNNPEFRAKKAAQSSARMKRLHASDPVFKAKTRARSSARLKAIHAAARKLAELETAAQ